MTAFMFDQITATVYPFTSSRRFAPDRIITKRQMAYKRLCKGKARYPVKLPCGCYNQLHYPHYLCVRVGREGFFFKLFFFFNRRFPSVYVEVRTFGFLFNTSSCIDPEGKNVFQSVSDAHKETTDGSSQLNVGGGGLVGWSVGWLLAGWLVGV